MNLVIDIGNTRLKAALFSNNKIRSRTQIRNDVNLEKTLKPFIYKADQIIISSVSDLSREFERTLVKFHKGVHILNQQTLLPFKNKYATPQTLGKDRIANAAAAATCFPGENVLVIDAGTCLKFDFVDRKQNYHGGAISPGLDMRFKALHQMTDKLPLLKPLKQASFIGNSTQTSIRSGVQTGMIEEIKGVMALYRKKHKNVITIITGGDFRFFANQLKTHIFARPDFTLEGLNEILKLNI